MNSAQGTNHGVSTLGERHGARRRAQWTAAWPWCGLPTVLTLSAACGDIDAYSLAFERKSHQPSSSPRGAVLPVAPERLVLDSFSDGDSVFEANAIRGEWFTYADGTGVVTPADHTGVSPVGGEVHVVGQGFTSWGVGLSAYFATPTDLTAYRGIVLRAKGSGSVSFELVTPATTPPEEGGTCLGEGCYGHFSAVLPLGPEYQDFAIDFAALAQPEWAQPATLSVASVISFNFLSHLAPDRADIDLWVDELALRYAPGGEQH